MNRIECGDSRELLKTVETGTVHCCYFDPPFNSNRNYYLTPDNKLGFKDKFKDKEDYISLVEPMIEEIKRTLTEDGSMFFHISADQLLIPLMLCEKHFKRVQVITWLRSRSKNNVKNKIGACVDMIIWCSNVAKPKFNMVYQPLDAYYLANSYKNEDDRGNYALGHITYTKTQAPNKEKDAKKEPHKQRYYSYTHNGVVYEPEHGWRMDKSALEELVKQDRVHFPKKEGAKPYKKIYAHESPGKPCTDLWDDVHSLTQGPEKRLYPTQKPIKLMERIIEMSTDPGDVVLDPVAGSGSTGVAAINLKRSYILFDKNPEAVILCKERTNKGGSNGV